MTTMAMATINSTSEEEGGETWQHQRWGRRAMTAEVVDDDEGRLLLLLQLDITTTIAT